MKLIRTLIALLLATTLSGLPWLAQAQQGGVVATGSITTQNLVPLGTATANSSVEVITQNKGVVGVQVLGTWTGTLSAYCTVNSSTWVINAWTPVTANGLGVINAAGCMRIRVAASAAVTGTALVTLQATDISPTAAATGGGSTSDATAALQTAGNASLSSIDSKASSLTNIDAKIATSYSASTSFTSGTTAYAALDVVGGALTFSNICASGGRILITSIALRIDSSAVISGQAAYQLHLYDATPPSAIADSAVFDVPSGDRANYLGSIAITAPADLGSTLYMGMDGVNKQLKCATASTSLYGYLVSVGAYTPTAQVYAVSIHATGL